MKNLLLFASLSLLFFSVKIKAGDDFSSDQFSLPQKVKKQTSLPQEVSVYFSNVTYNLPEKEKHNNILAANEISDPLECYNRSMFSFNSFIINNIIRPAGIGYTFVVPEYARKGIHRMYNNIEMPGRFINCLLQGRFKRSGIEFCRFAVNTTAGIAGFYEVAEPYLGMIPQTNSFGQTFAYWGIGPGCYFVIPIQGGSTLRDTIGLAGDWAADPITWIPPYNVVGINYVSFGIKTGLEFNDMTLVIDDYIRVYNASADPYYTLKTMAVAINKVKQEDLKNDGYEPLATGKAERK